MAPHADHPDDLHGQERDALRGQQRALYLKLAEKSPDLAVIYLGALVVLNDARNPDALALAVRRPTFIDHPCRDHLVLAFERLGMRRRSF